MDIKTDITITLSSDEITKIISDYLKTQGYKTNTVNFNIVTHYDEGDWRGEYPIECLKNATCKVEKNEQ